MAVDASAYSLFLHDHSRKSPNESLNVTRLVETSTDVKIVDPPD
jgi:hypothetical protein